MRLDTFRRLLEPPGQEALRAAHSLDPREDSFLIHYQQLTRCYDPELSRLALEVAILRGEAGDDGLGAGELPVVDTVDDGRIHRLARVIQHDDAASFSAHIMDCLIEDALKDSSQVERGGHLAADME